MNQYKCLPAVQRQCHDADCCDGIYNGTDCDCAKDNLDYMPQTVRDELMAYRSIGPASEFRALKEAEQKRREGCKYCVPDRDGHVKTLVGLITIHDGKLCAKGLRPLEINQCFMCGRDLKGESHDRN